MKLDYLSSVGGNVCINTTKLPSYLSTFLECNDDIVLVYAKRKSVSSGNDTDLYEESFSRDEVENSALDLTGSPLKTDLNGDDALDISLPISKPPNWSSEEAKHYPLSLTDARKFLREHNRKQRLLSLYCVCDGSDRKHTVCVATHLQDKQWTNIAVYALGAHSVDEDIMSVQFMENDHKKMLGSPLSIVYVSRSLYSIVGYKLRNCNNLHQSRINGSVSIETVSSQCSLVPTNYKNMKMNLAVIAGHKHSEINFLWQQLGLLNKYIAILEDKEKFEGESTSICDSPLDNAKIQAEIYNCFKLVIHEQKENSNFDLKNLRHETFLDKLFKILQKCECLGDLRNAFHLIFEELADTDLKLQIPIQKSELVVVDILNGIFNGTLAVPTLNFRQSLELLLELGLEHLKNDYMAIAKHFYLLPQEGIINKWNDLCNKEVNVELKRKTRMTLHHGNSTIANPKSNAMKHSFLHNLHIILDFLFLIEDCSLSEDSIENLCTKLFNVYIEKSPRNVFETKKLELFEISFHLNSLDSKILETKVPVLSTLQMTSSTKFMKFTTVFQVSSDLTFPTAIFKDCDTYLSDGETKLYLSKMVKTVEIIKTK